MEQRQEKKRKTEKERKIREMLKLFKTKQRQNIRQLEAKRKQSIGSSRQRQMAQRTDAKSMLKAQLPLKCMLTNAKINAKLPLN